MAERPALSRGEMEVARVLWQLKSATVRQVHEAFPEERDIDYATVQTYLRRLAQKGYVRARLDGRVRVYTPRIKPRTVIRETLDDLIERLFGGDPVPLMQHLIEDRGMSDGDIQRLRQMIDRHDTDSSAADPNG